MRRGPVRVAVVSPHPLIRAGLVGLVSELEERALVTEAVAVDTGLLSHDVAIYDAGGVVGLSVYEDLQALMDGGVQVVALVYDRLRATLPAVRGETAHTITLSVTSEELLQILEQATADGAVTSGDETAGELPAGLSPRELEVLRLIASDYSNGDIATRLYISPNTLKTYIRTGYRKIGVNNRSGAIHWAIRHGLTSGVGRQVAAEGSGS